MRGDGKRLDLDRLEREAMLVMDFDPPLCTVAAADLRRLVRIARAAERLLESGVVIEHDKPALFNPFRADQAAREMRAALEGREP